MLFGPIIAAMFSALRIALFSALDATRPPDIWNPGEHLVNSTSSWFSVLSFDTTTFMVPAWHVLYSAVVDSGSSALVIPPPSVTVIAIHPSKAHSSLGHTFHLGSLFQAFHCAYEAPQFVSELPSRCVAVLKPTPISTVVYVPPTPVIKAIERFFLPSVTWSTDIHWRVWTMIVNVYPLLVPCLELAVIEILAIALFWLSLFCARRVVSLILNYSRG